MNVSESDMEKFWKVLQSAVASAAAVGFENTAILVVDKRNGLNPDNLDGWVHAAAPQGDTKLDAAYSQWLCTNDLAGSRADFMGGARPTFRPTAWLR